MKKSANNTGLKIVDGDVANFEYECLQKLISDEMTLEEFVERKQRRAKLDVVYCSESSTVPEPHES